MPSEKLKNQLDEVVVLMQAEGMGLAEARQIFEGSYVTVALDAADNYKSRAAKTAKIDRSNFRRLLRKHGIE